MDLWGRQAGSFIPGMFQNIRYQLLLTCFWQRCMNQAIKKAAQCRPQPQLRTPAQHLLDGRKFLVKRGPLFFYLFCYVEAALRVSFPPWK